MAMRTISEKSDKATPFYLILSYKMNLVKCCFTEKYYFSPNETLTSDIRHIDNSSVNCHIRKLILIPETIVDKSNGINANNYKHRFWYCYCKKKNKHNFDCKPSKLTCEDYFICPNSPLLSVRSVILIFGL